MSLEWLFTSLKLEENSDTLFTDREHFFLTTPTINYDAHWLGTEDMKQILMATK